MTLRIATDTFTAERKLEPAEGTGQGFVASVTEALEVIRGCDFGAEMLAMIEKAGEELVIVKAGEGVDNKCAQKLDDDPACDKACYLEVLNTGLLHKKLKELDLPATHPAAMKFEKFHGAKSEHKAMFNGNIPVPMAHKPKAERQHGADRTLAGRMFEAKIEGIEPVRQACGWVQHLQNGLVGYHVMDQLTPGPGTAAWVVWDPQLLDVGQGLAAEKQAKWMKRPPWLALAHELIHGWRLVSGRCVFRPNSRSEPYYEEAMTVGLPPYDRCRYTENRFRHKHGLPLRKYYGEATQAQTVAARKKHGSVKERLAQGV